MMKGSVFARLVLVMLAMVLPLAYGGGTVMTVDGDKGLDKMELSAENQMVLVEMVKEGKQPNPAFDYSALMLQDTTITFARVDLSLPENSPWTKIAAAAEFPFAVRVVPPNEDGPQWLAFRNVPDDEEAMVQLFYATYQENVIIPSIKAAISSISWGIDSDLDKGEEPSTEAYNHAPWPVIIKGYVEVKKSFTWAPRLATMADGVLKLEPIEGKSIFGNEVISLEDKTVVEGCDSEKDGGCFSIYKKEDIQKKKKKKKPVAQLRVSDPHDAEAWARYITWQLKEQNSLGQPASASATRSPAATSIEIGPTLLAVGDAKSTVDSVADEAANLLEPEADTKARQGTSETDNAITDQEKTQDTWTFFGLFGEAGPTSSRHTVTVSPEMLHHLGLKHGNSITLRGSKRGREQVALVASGDSELSHFVGIDEKLRKALGVEVGGFVILVQDKVFPTSPPHRYMCVLQRDPVFRPYWREQPIQQGISKHKGGFFASSSDTGRIAPDSLYPSSPPLVLGSHLSSACSQDHGFYERAGLGKKVDSRRVCLYPTDKGSVRIARGDEPMPDQKPLWEAGGGGPPKARRLGGFFGGARVPSTGGRGGEQQDGEDMPVEDVAVCIRHGRLVVGRSGSGTTVVDVTYKSPRPRGWWKVYLSQFSRTGRSIRDAGLRLSPEGRVTMETEDGTVLWEVDLPDAGQEDVCLMA